MTGAGVRLAMIFGALLGLSGLLGAAYIKGRHDGRIVCEARQIKSDAHAWSLAETGFSALKAAARQYAAASERIRTDYQAGLTREDLKRARREGYYAGRAQARKEALQYARETNTCLNLPYGDADRLRWSARSLQDDLFEDRPGSDEPAQALDVSAPAGRAPVPDPAPDKDQRPDR